MKRLRVLGFLFLAVVTMASFGCGGFMAKRMAQAPNTYPTWLGPKAPVRLAFEKNFLTNFPAQFVNVGPPSARLRYRIVDPAGYRMNVKATNWLDHGRRHFKFSFDAILPGRRNAWTDSPRGTVVLLHGYSLGQFAMAPWALSLAERGWRCVLVDLRGHGKSTGKRIYFGITESFDLSQLLDRLERDRLLIKPIAAMGESYGASLALRWKTKEPRVESVVAIAPYAALSSAVLNICEEYAKWLPNSLLKAGLRNLPPLLKTEPQTLNTAFVLNQIPVAALFVAGSGDRITPVDDVRSLRDAAKRESELVVVENATHEALPYYFDDLLPVVTGWLGRSNACASNRIQPEISSE